MRLPPCACNTLALSAHRAHAWPSCKGFFHNSPHTHPQKRGGSRQDHDICLFLNEIQNSAEMQVGGRSLFSEQHAPKPSANTFLRAQPAGGADSGAHAQVCIYQPPSKHTSTQTHNQRFYRLPLWFSRTQANRLKYRLWPPQPWATL